MSGVASIGNPPTSANATGDTTALPQLERRDTAIPNADSVTSMDSTSTGESKGCCTILLDCIANVFSCICKSLAQIPWIGCFFASTPEQLRNQAAAQQLRDQTAALIDRQRAIGQRVLVAAEAIAAEAIPDPRWTVSDVLLTLWRLELAVLNPSEIVFMELVGVDIQMNVYLETMRPRLCALLQQCGQWDDVRDLSVPSNGLKHRLDARFDSGSRAEGNTPLGISYWQDIQLPYYRHRLSLWEDVAARRLPPKEL